MFRVLAKRGRAMLLALSAGFGELIVCATYAIAALLGPSRTARLLRSVSLPRLREHRLRTTLTVFGIALGVAVLVSVTLVSRSIVHGVTETIGELAGRADLQISASAGGLDEKLLERVRRVNGVYKSTPVMQQIVPVKSDSGARERLLMFGVDLLGTDDSYFRDYDSSELDAIRRDALEFLNSTTNVILSEAVARRLGVGVHDQISIATSTGWQRFEVWGLIRGDEIASAFGGAVGLMYFPALQVAFERGHNVDRIDVAVAPGRDPEEVATALERALGEGYIVERPARRGERVERLLETMRTSLGTACALALIAGAFLVFNTMSISVMQRRRELGILRALGVTRGQLTRLITLEGTLLGIVGSVLGVGLGLLISKNMLRLTSRAVDAIHVQQSVTEVRLEPWLVLASIALGLIAACVAALFATRRAAVIRPSQALSNSGSAPAPVSRSAFRADAWGCALLALSIWLASLPAVRGIPLGPFAATALVPFVGRLFMPRIMLLLHATLALARHWSGPSVGLASENVLRDLTRSASTASGLMAGGALSISLATFIVSFVSSLNAWTAQTVPGDLYVTSGAAIDGMSARNNPMADSLRAELLAIPGVERVRPTRTANFEYRDARLSLVATDVTEFVKRSSLFAVEGEPDAMRDALLRGAVVVSEGVSRRFDIHPGDRITLGTSGEPRSFEVAGVRIDYSNDQGTVLMDRATYLEYWNDTRVDSYEIHVLAGESAEAVRDRINEHLSDAHDLFVLTNREYRSEFTKRVDHIFDLFHVLELVTLLVAALGMLTAILANVLDRVREIGVLRAIGMLRAQVRRMVVLESAFLGIVGGLVGIAVGTAIGYVSLRCIITVQVGWYLPYQLPAGPMLQFLIITLLISAFAGFLPAREAARLPVRAALDFE